jgi:hypothetical protein
MAGFRIDGVIFPDGRLWHAKEDEQMRDDSHSPPL